MKPLLPSLREKKRYLVFEIISKKDLDFSKVSKAITDTTIKFLGGLTYAKAGISILKDKFKNNKGIIKVTNPYVDHVKSSLCLVKSIDNEDVIIKSVRVVPPRFYNKHAVNEFFIIKFCCIIPFYPIYYYKPVTFF